MINYQHTNRPTMPTPRQSVTLRQGDVYSLTTGKITRSEIHNPDPKIQRKIALRNRNVKGLRANYLVALMYMIEKDPSIPHQV